MGCWQCPCRLIKLRSLHGVDVVSSAAKSALLTTHLHMTLPPPLPRPARPVFVSIISACYLISLIVAGLSLSLAYFGSIPLPPSQRAYLDSLSWLDHAVTIFIMILKLAGVVALFSLRRAAFYFFACGFLVAIASMVYQIIAKNYLQAVGFIVLPGIIVGWSLSAAVIIYIWDLSQKGVLR